MTFPIYTDKIPKREAPYLCAADQFRYAECLEKGQKEAAEKYKKLAKYRREHKDE